MHCTDLYFYYDHEIHAFLSFFSIILPFNFRFKNSYTFSIMGNCLLETKCLDRIYNMVVYFTEEVSSDIKQRIDFVASSRMELEKFFLHKEYGRDLNVLYISLVCVHPRYADFFKVRKPKYVPEAKEYIEKGVVVLREGKSLSYDLRLDYSKYLSEINPKLLFSQEVLNSLEVINTIKKIMDFDLALFRGDLEQFFKLNGWLR